jgi:hypothetical protein
VTDGPLGLFSEGIDAARAIDLLMTAIEQCDCLLEACVGSHEAVKTAESGRGDGVPAAS